MSGADVQDDFDARLVVLGVEHPYTREPGNAAEASAKAILESRGHAPRIFRNTLVFLAVDKTKLQDLDEAVRRFLAWESILGEKEVLDLSPHQVRQAEAQKASADGTVVAQLPEAYQWLLVPVQSSPQAEVQWQASRLSGQDPLAVRASKKLRNDELLLPTYAASRLRMELDKVPLWRGNHAPVKQLFEDFAKYIYLPRLKEPRVLTNAIQSGVALLTWSQDSFAYADSFDESANRYRGLVFARMITVTPDSAAGILVRPDVALKQAEVENAARSGEGVPTAGFAGAPGSPTTTAFEAGEGRGKAPTRRPNRFHGSVSLDPARVGRDAGRIADEVVAHLSGLVSSTVKVTLEIEASVTDGVSDDVVRIVTENARTLKFNTQGFETE
jgi:hypothetical protein